jgi:CBS domain-containing protein
MTTKISEIMTPNPVTVTPSTTLSEVARLMRDDNIGDVIIAERRKLQGIVTDRDIVVRAVTEDMGPQSMTVSDICSTKVATVSPDDEIERAVNLMRARAVRRLPVTTENGEVVGVVSLGDLALERDKHSVLADISAAKPNI